MCWLKESLLSRITPRYLSDLTSSRTMEFDESELSMFRLLYTAVEVVVRVCCSWSTLFIVSTVMRHFTYHDVLSDRQHGFRTRLRCEPHFTY